jgi:transcriptional regulator with XRE-family HTH domain
MQKISLEVLADTVKVKREELSLTKEKLGNLTGIHRLQIGRLEKREFFPSLPQIEKLCEVLKFEFSSLFLEDTREDIFLALRGKAETVDERNGVEKMISMMLCFRKQEVLRKRLHG